MSHQNVLLPPSPTEPLVRYGGVTVHPDQTLVKLQKNHRFSILPRNTPATTVLQSGSNDIIFDLSPNSIDYIDRLLLQFTVTNTDGSNALALTDGFSLIDYITIECSGSGSNNGGGGQKEVQKLHGQALRKEFLVCNSTEKLVNPLAQIGISASTFVANVSIAPSGTFTYRIPIHCILDTANVKMRSSKVVWRMTFRVQTGPAAISASSAAAITAASVSGVSLIVHGKINDGGEARESVLYNYLTQSKETLSLGSAVSGTPVQVTMSGSGLLSHLWIDYAAQSTTNLSLHQPLAITSVELMKNSETISHGLGDKADTYALSKMFVDLDWANPTLFSALNTALLCFSDEPQEAIQKGANHGFQRTYGDSEMIRVVPGATQAGAQLNCYGNWWSSLLINHSTGDVKLFKNIMS